MMVSKITLSILSYADHDDCRALTSIRCTVVKKALSNDHSTALYHILIMKGVESRSPLLVEFLQLLSISGGAGVREWT